MEDLVRAALDARSRAYCPYSGYAVGAALLGSDGQVWTGCNVENVSYGATVCAERTALVTMVAAGERRWRTLAVATRDGGTPCGVCLQVLAEFCEDPATATVVCLDEEGAGPTRTFLELFPFAFRTDLGQT